MPQTTPRLSDKLTPLASDLTLLRTLFDAPDYSKNQKRYLYCGLVEIAQPLSSDCPASPDYNHHIRFTMFKLLTLITLSIFGMQSFVLASGPSSVPTTGYTCPSADNGGFSLGDSDLNSSPIFCSYPATPGENPNDFYCTYSAVCYLTFLHAPLFC